MSEPQTDSDAMFQKWKGWLDPILIDVRGLHVNRYIYKTVSDIVGRNPAIQTDDTFYQWMAEAYAGAQLIGIRRQLDSRADSISLARLLHEISKHPQILSRSRYLSFYKADFPPQYANRNFDNLAGGGRDYIDPESVASDLSLLNEKAGKIGKYASKRIAHWDVAEHKEIPTYDDLDSCLDYLERLLKKYINVFTANSVIRILPAWQYDWTEIFRVPWIRKEVDAEIPLE